MQFGLNKVHISSHISIAHTLVAFFTQSSFFIIMFFVVVLFLLHFVLFDAASARRPEISSYDGEEEEDISRALTTGTSWDVQFGTTSSDNCQGVVVDGSGDVITVGYTFGSLYGTSAGNTDYWVSKRSGSDGSCIWGVQYGQIAVDFVNAVAVDDSSGDMYCTGRTAGALYGTLTGAVDYWVSKLSGLDGSLVWGVQRGSSDGDNSNSIAVGSSGSVYTSGSTAGSLYATVAGGNDYYVTKLNGTDGSLIWGVQYGTNLDDSSNAIAVDSSGNVFCSGETAANLYGVYAGGSKDLWISKLSGLDGSLVWGVQQGTSVDEYSNSLAVDSNGDVYCGGATGGSLYLRNK
jgi:hypothetical protein